MRKIIVTITAFLYMACATGAAVSMHYCMGKLVKWDLGHSSSRTCDECGMLKGSHKDGGCEDKQAFLKNTNDQDAIETGFQPIKSFTALSFTAFSELASDKVYRVIKSKTNVPGPHWRHGPDIYICNCVFLI